MKALVQEGYGSADALHLRDIPRPVLTDVPSWCACALVRECSRLAHDTRGLLLEIIAKLMRQKDEPVRGVDVAGTVEAVGPNVTRFKPATRFSAARLRPSRSTYAAVRIDCF